MSAEITAELVALSTIAGPGTALPLSHSRSTLETLSAPGSATIVFQNDDPALSSVLPISPLKAINFKLNGTLFFTMLLEPMTRASIEPTEELDEQTKIAGRGNVAVLDRAVIYPALGPDRTPVQEDRAFNWTDPTYDDSGWTGATVLMTAATAKIAGNWPPGGAASQFPQDFPDDTADLIWDPTGATGAPGGDVYFRQTISVPAAGNYTLYPIYGQQGEILVDGMLMMGDVSFDPTAVEPLQQVGVTLSAGSHVIACRATNLDTGGPAALCWALGQASFGSFTLIAHSDGTSVIVAYPSQPPGMSPGKAILIALGEAQTRGALTYVTTSFDDTLDTDGNPWPIVADIATKVGGSLLTFLTELSNTYVDFAMAPGTLVLDAWTIGGRGSASATTFAEGVNLTRLEQTIDAGLHNVELVRYAGGWHEEENGASVSAYERIEATLGLGALGSLAEVARVSGGQLAIFADPREQIACAIAPTGAGDLPYVDFAVGDTVTVPDSAGVSAAQRVLEIGVSDQPNDQTNTGRALYSVTLKDVILEAQERFSQAIQKMVNGTFGGRSSVAQPVVPTYVPRSLISPNPAVWSAPLSIGGGGAQAVNAASDGARYIYFSAGGGGIDSFKLCRYDTLTQTLVTDFSAAAPQNVADSEFLWFDSVNNGIVYAPGTTPGNNAYRYNIGPDNWTTLAAPSIDASVMAAGEISRVLYFAGGLDATATPTDLGAKYDVDADTWTNIANMPQARSYIGGGCAGGQFHAIGGFSTGPNTDHTDGFSYDPGPDSWASLVLPGDFTVADAELVTGGNLSGGDLVFGMGDGSGGYSGRWWRFDGTTFTVLPPSDITSYGGIAQSYACACTLGDTVYLILARSGGLYVETLAL